jgi:hypothetical protein
VLRSHIDHCVYRRVFCLQRGTIHRRQWQLRKVHEDVEEMVMATVHMGEYVQTMGRPGPSGREAAIPVFSEVIASVIGIGIW